MSSFDVLIIAITLFFILRGWLKGFVEETFNLIFIFLIFYLSFKYYSIFATLIGKIIGAFDFNKPVAFIVLILMLGLVGTLLKKFITYPVQRFKFLNTIDKILGALTGLVIGALITFGISYFIMFFLDPTILHKSKIFPYYEKIFNEVIKYLQ